VRSAFLKQRRTLLDVRSVFLKLRRTLLDVRSALLKLRRTLLDVRSALLKQRRTLLDVRSAFLKQRRTLLDVRSAFLKQRRTLLDVRSALLSQRRRLLYSGSAFFGTFPPGECLADPRKEVLVALFEIDLGVVAFLDTRGGLRPPIDEGTEIGSASIPRGRRRGGDLHGPRLEQAHPRSEIAAPSSNPPLAASGRDVLPDDLLFSDWH
jgi:hypothetical protein